MGKKLSIITPHKDNYEGLLAILSMLHNQTSSDWEWIIVDDFSNNTIRTKLKNNQDFVTNKIKIIYNNENLKASKSRNIGLKDASGSNVVFLDSDDEITFNFVLNRLVDVTDFKVFLNFKIKDIHGNLLNYSKIKEDFFNNFLKAKFSWVVTSVLWEKEYIVKIGSFDENIILLEDIEITIRAMSFSSHYEILTNNQIDFFYNVRPIDIKKRSIDEISKSVDELVRISCENFNLSKKQKSYLSSYYFLSIKYFCRSKEFKKIKLVKNNINTIYKYNCINIAQYLVGIIIIKLFTLNLLSLNKFLNFNRFFYKK